jgi:hypothetical protein
MAAQSVRAAFDQWLSHQPSAPRRGADLICNETPPRMRTVTRLVSRIEHRELVWSTSPAPGRQRLGAAPLEPMELDPWSPPPDLAVQSRYVTTCGDCHGPGKVECEACAGTARVTCDECSGSGKHVGYTSNGARRLLNCKVCRGKGDVVCLACSRGHVSCPVCDGARHVTRWLEVRSTHRDELQTSDPSAVARFAWSRDLAAADDAIALDVEIIDRRSSSRRLPDDVVDVPLNPGERVVAQTLLILDVPAVTVTYRAFGSDETVTFVGKRLNAEPARSVLLGRRARSLRALGVGLALLPIAAWIVYAARGTYFQMGRGGVQVAGIAISLALFGFVAYRFAWNATLRRRRKNVWAIAAVIPLLMLADAVVTAEPRIGRARDFIATHRLVEAHSELAALGPESDTALAPVWTDLHLADVLDATSCESASSIASKIGSSPQHVAAIAHANALALGASERALAAGDVDAASTAIACMSPDARASVTARELLGQIAFAASSRCVTAKQWDCALDKTQLAASFGADAAVSRACVLAAIQSEVDADASSARKERDLDARLRLESSALELWSRYLASSAAKPATIVALEASKARDDRAHAAQAEQARKLAVAAAEQQRVAEEREARRQAAAAAREQQQAAYDAYASSSLMCNDGTESPTCTCGGSHRGCCSHHGGVAGCAR